MDQRIINLFHEYTHRPLSQGKTYERANVGIAGIKKR